MANEGKPVPPVLNNLVAVGLTRVMVGVIMQHLERLRRICVCLTTGVPVFISWTNPSDRCRDRVGSDDMLHLGNGVHLAIDDSSNVVHIRKYWWKKSTNELCPFKKGELRFFIFLFNFLFF